MNASTARIITPRMKKRREPKVDLDEFQKRLRLLDMAQAAWAARVDFPNPLPTAGEVRERQMREMERRRRRRQNFKADIRR